ncbi:S-layer homology domain-containing protein [Paenibacillus sp. FSL R5-0345]|uniref:S-layer homology domain-containing protein n=1 Tax=Paenibacillus sp. FSL R5-0345 TaxID=1536770 RepID=UPI0012E0B423
MFQQDITVSYSDIEGSYASDAIRQLTESGIVNGIGMRITCISLYRCYGEPYHK